MYSVLIGVFVLGLSIKISYAEQLLNASNFKIEQKFEEGKLMHYAYLKDVNNWTAKGYYDAFYNTTGWDVLETITNGNVTDHLQAYGAGLVEGVLTWEAIYKHHYNSFKNYCVGRKKLCKKIDEFVDKNTKWVMKMIKENGQRSSPWHQVNLIYIQIKGLYDGYTAGSYGSGKKLSYKDILKMNLIEELDDIAEAIGGFDIPAKVRGSSHCSAIVKLLPKNKDILIGHNTWTSYESMIRILKKYSHYYHTSSHSTMVVPGSSMAFSGYPGTISSVDDFYIMSSKIVALETTIGNSNKTLWNNVTPTGQVFESVRSLIANRLANNGRSWGEAFGTSNSGTYNNQWMIVDLNKFTAGSKPQEGLLYILEQIPGYIRMEDQTFLFIKQKYWPSYNTPFYKDVFNMSGNQELVDKYGDWFTYDKTPRALIFKRDHKKIKGINSLLSLLRSNNYKHDPYGKCNCTPPYSAENALAARFTYDKHPRALIFKRYHTEITNVDTLLALLRSNDYKHDPYGKCSNCTPPYSAENALAARSDLNPINGNHLFPTLGHRSHGSVDTKVTSYEWITTTQFKAVCGPTTGSGLPKFKWSTSDFKDKVSHYGQPHSFEFDPVLYTWYYNTTNYNFQ